ncbi:hypothetical protein HK096_011104, partial [Nowakowskiella sp. JEL0078]
LPSLQITLPSSINLQSDPEDVNVSLSDFFENKTSPSPKKLHPHDNILLEKPNKGILHDGYSTTNTDTKPNVSPTSPDLLGLELENKEIFVSRVVYHPIAISDDENDDVELKFGSLSDTLEELEGNDRELDELLNFDFNPSNIRMKSVNYTLPHIDPFADRDLLVKGIGSFQQSKSAVTKTKQAKSPTKENSLLMDKLLADKRKREETRKTVNSIDLLEKELENSLNYNKKTKKRSAESVYDTFKEMMKDDE